MDRVKDVWKCIIKWTIYSYHFTIYCHWLIYWYLWHVHFLTIFLVKKVLRKMPTGIVFSDWLRYSLIGSSSHRIWLELSHLYILLVGIIKDFIVILIVRETLLVIQYIINVVCSSHIMINHLRIFQIILHNAIWIQVLLRTRILELICVLLNYP